MIIRNVSESNILEALQTINEKYDGNIRIFGSYSGISGIDPVNAKGTAFKFRLWTNSAYKPGHRFTGLYMGRRRHHASACWHVHGDFFDALFSINPNATVRVGRVGKITRDGGNWQDYNIGSQMVPVNASEACECIELNMDDRRFLSLARRV